MPGMQVDVQETLLMGTEACESAQEKQLGLSVLLWCCLSVPFNKPCCCTAMESDPTDKYRLRMALSQKVAGVCSCHWLG